MPKEFPADHRVWLRFEAVDWRADVWVDGKKVGEHDGGYTPFEFDITDAVRRDGENTLVVRAFDPTDPSLPTGKQIHWYTPSSGIWQTVWLEARPKSYIADFRITPSLDPARVTFHVDAMNLPRGGEFQVRAEAKHSDGGDRFSGVKAVRVAAGLDPVRVHGRRPGRQALDSGSRRTSTHVTLELRDDQQKTIDSIQTYFGLRTIGRGKYGDEPFERILLNGKPLYLRAALDQSFNPKGIYTAPG